MSHPKVKQESYVNIKGINTKTSVYDTEDGTVLELENYDFQTPGAWTKRWGFTNAAAGSTVVVSGKIVDMITNYGSIYGIQNLVLSESAPYSYSATTGAFKALQYAGSTNTPLYSGASPTQISMRNFNNFTFWTTGVTVYKYSYQPQGGVDTTASGVFSLPVPGISTIGISLNGTGGGFSGVYRYKFGYHDPFGFIVAGQRPWAGYFGTPSEAVTISASGATTIGLASLPVPGFSLVTNPHDADAIIIYRDRVFGYPSTDFVSIGSILRTTPPATPTFFDVSPDTGAGATVFQLNSTYAGYPEPTNPAFSIFPNTDLNFGFIKIKYLEVYSNRLWLANKASNSIYFSELMAPQVVESENYFSLVGNETDIMGLKAFNQSLMIGMRKGMFRLTGSDQSNFNVQEVTNEYGVIANKSMVVWHEKLWFLDQGRIVQYDGANFTKVSDAIESILRTVDFDAAEENASAMHVQKRNEIWFSVPILGSTFNRILVYDYLIGAWTTFKAISATALNELYTLSDPTVGSYPYQTERNPRYFFGSPGGSLYYFDPTFKQDNGANITLSFKTKYHMPFAKTAVAQFRRFMLDTGPIAATLSFNLDFYKNYATLTAALTRTLVTSDFQRRIDYGIPAQSLALRVSHSSGNTDHYIYGYTVESRFQRNVNQ